MGILEAQRIQSDPPKVEKKITATEEEDPAAALKTTQWNNKHECA